MEKKHYFERNREPKPAFDGLKIVIWFLFVMAMFIIAVIWFIQGVIDFLQKILQ